jgi:hypothetical protein
MWTLKADVSILWRMANWLISLIWVSAVDYNSWIESPKALKLASKLDKDVVLAEGTCFGPSQLAKLN